MGSLGEGRPRLLHGQARDLRHLDDAIGVRDRRTDEGERGRGCDPDRHEGHPAAAAALAGRMAPRRLEHGGLERLGEDGRRPLGSLDRVDDRRPDRRRCGTEALADLDRTRPVRGIGREQGVDERRRLRRSVRHAGEQRRSGLVGPPQPDRQPVVALERGAPRQQPEEQAAERVHVGGGLAVGASCLLGRPVLGCPEQHALGRDAGRRACDPREAEVGDDDAPGGALDQDVARA